MDQPKVSICMPTYNNEKFIFEAINSCLNQSYQNIEICISDDKSTDKTFEIVKEFANLYPKKIKLYQMEKNMGDKSIAYNVNKAFGMCEGKYIAILEGDDSMLPCRIEKQVKFLEDNPSVFAVHHDLIVYDEISGSVIEKKWTLRNRKVSSKELVLYKNYVFTPTLMFRNIDVKFDPAIKRKLDWYLMVKLSEVGEFFFQDEKLTKYRLHENNITKKGFEDDVFIILSLIEKSYPNLITYVNVRRTMNYMKEVKNCNSEYILPMFSMGLFNIFLSIVYKIKHSRKILMH